MFKLFLQVSPNKHYSQIDAKKPFSVPDCKFLLYNIKVRKD